MLVVIIAVVIVLVIMIAIKINDCNHQNQSKNHSVIQVLSNITLMLAIVIMIPATIVIGLLCCGGTACRAGLRCSQADGWCPGPQGRRRHVVPPTEQVSCTACLVMLSACCAFAICRGHL